MNVVGMCLFYPVLRQIKVLLIWILNDEARRGRKDVKKTNRSRPYERIRSFKLGRVHVCCQKFHWCTLVTNLWQCQEGINLVDNGSSPNKTYVDLVYLSSAEYIVLVTSTVKVTRRATFFRYSGHWGTKTVLVNGSNFGPHIYPDSNCYVLTCWPGQNAIQGNAPEGSDTFWWHLWEEIAWAEIGWWNGTRKKKSHYTLIDCRTGRE